MLKSPVSRRHLNFNGSDRTPGAMEYASPVHARCQWVTRAKADGHRHIKIQDPLTDDFSCVKYDRSIYG